MALALPRRFRIPPFLPAYTILTLALAYAVITFSLGTARLDAIAQFAELANRNATTLHALGGFREAVNDIETGGRGFALTADDSYLERFERGRRRAPEFLVTLRDQMRDSPDELTIIEKLVPLLAERTLISASGIEQRRSAPEQPYRLTFGSRGRESSEEIRAILADLEARERDQTREYRENLANTIRDARRDMYVMSGIMLLLVVSLYFAVVRLRAFMRVESGDDSAVALGLAPADQDSGVRTLLRDALLRARLAVTAAEGGSADNTQRRALVATMEQAVKEQALVERDAGEQGDVDRPRPPQTLAQGLARLAQSYSRADGLIVRATIDRQAEVDNPDSAFVIFRSAEWALEAITLRRRTGEVFLNLGTNGEGVSLRISALADSPQFPLRLTPKENEQAHALQQAVAGAGGSFLVHEGPTGFMLTLTLPFQR
jgi:CHASE3 domain sensor protein